MTNVINLSNGGRLESIVHDNMLVLKHSGVTHKMLKQLRPIKAQLTFINEVSIRSSRISFSLRVEKNSSVDWMVNRILDFVAKYLEAAIVFANRQQSNPKQSHGHNPSKTQRRAKKDMSFAQFSHTN